MSISAQINFGNTKPVKLVCIFNLEQGDSRKFIIPYSIERHNDESRNPGTIYKSEYVNDLYAMCSQLQSARINVIADPESYRNGRFASPEDSEGNQIQLWEPIIEL